MRNEMEIILFRIFFFLFFIRINRIRTNALAITNCVCNSIKKKIKICRKRNEGIFHNQPTNQPNKKSNRSVHRLME